MREKELRHLDFHIIADKQNQESGTHAQVAACTCTCTVHVVKWAAHLKVKLDMHM